MPRFVVETVAADERTRVAARALIPARFPELTIEQIWCRPTGDQWKCWAPSEAHLHRWAAASHLVVRSLERADAATTNNKETP